MVRVGGVTMKWNYKESFEDGIVLCSVVSSVDYINVYILLVV